MNCVMKVPHVIRIKGIYHFRYSIPADCRKNLSGRTEVKKSLSTTDILDAKKQSEKLTLIWRAKIERVRAKNSLQGSPASTHSLDLDAIAQFLREVA